MLFDLRKSQFLLFSITRAIPPHGHASSIVPANSRWNARAASTARYPGPFVKAAEREELFDIYLGRCRWTRIYFLGLKNRWRQSWRSFTRWPCHRARSSRSAGRVRLPH